MKKYVTFCMIGKHDSPPIPKPEPSTNWRLLPANYDADNDTWFYDPDSPAKIWICPDHHLPGEPQLN